MVSSVEAKGQTIDQMDNYIVKTLVVEEERGTVSPPEIPITTRSSE